MQKIRLTTCGNYKFLTNPLDTYVGKSLEVYGEWSHGELSSISSLVQKDANIIEVGSNIGAHTVFIAKEICPEGNVYAFEPRRILFQNLWANLCINEISNDYAFQKALGLDFDIIFEGPIPQDGLANHGAFDLGSIDGVGEHITVEPLDAFSEQFQKIASVANKCPTHKLKIEGYTDSEPYGGGAKGYSNWELSAERANSARREWIAEAVPTDRITQVIGYGDSVPSMPQDPTNPLNRRISITIIPPKIKGEVKMGGMSPV